MVQLLARVVAHEVDVELIVSCLGVRCLDLVHLGNHDQERQARLLERRAHLAHETRVRFEQVYRSLVSHAAQLLAVKDQEHDVGGRRSATGGQLKPQCRMLR